jgi:hypothetical protein
VVRSGLPENHFSSALDEACRLGLLIVETPAEGLRLLVQPVAFWQERPRFGAEEFARAWERATAQGRMPLATEQPGLAEALAVNSERAGGGIGNADVAGPESGPVVPDSGGGEYRIPVVVPLNVHRLTPSEKIQNLLAVNVERLTGPGIRGRTGWVEPETEIEAMAACAELLGGREEMQQWGGLWRKRWRTNPDGLRKVLNMVREDQAVGRQPKAGSNWGRFAGDLWKRFVERHELHE